MLDRRAAELEAGTEFPQAMAMTPPEMVAEAVVSAIRKDLPEITIVHRRPIKAALMLYELAPKLTESLLRRPRRDRAGLRRHDEGTGPDLARPSGGTAPR